MNLDDAWSPADLAVPTRDLRSWGPVLRFSAPAREMERFHREQAGGLPPILIYGSGDFHHLSALWLRRLGSRTTVVSFDNHPDWDIRPPKWCCGGWVNRALDFAQVEKVSVWGCGNFECWWPGRIFGNNLAERSGWLEVHPWAEDGGGKVRARRGAILRENWREKFSAFVAGLGGAQAYVTIDLDCLGAEDAATNWESRRFTLEDVAWALELLGQGNRIVAGDICGAWSARIFARRKQRFAAAMDYPKLPEREPEAVRQTNRRALFRLLPLLARPVS